MARDATFYIDSALNAFNAGFTSKAGMKSALSDINYACDEYRRKLHDALLTIDREERLDNWDKLYYDAPSYIHQWSDKARTRYSIDIPESIQTVVDEYIADMDKIATIAAAIKDAEITPPLKNEVKEKVEAIRMSVVEMMEKRSSDFVHGVSLVEHFGKLPVAVSAHYVTNAHGTTFLRYFFYMNGRLTALNVILAVLDATRKD